MTVKEQVLARLDEQQGAYLSGEQLAEQLGVSRTAVWKAIGSLKADGFRIEGVTNKGYRLSPQTDMLTEASVRRHLPPEASWLRPEICRTVGSTNEALRRRAIAGEAEGLVILAEEQTEGRGRKGRAFYSPPGTGLYMSLLLRPHGDATEAPLLTVAAAVAVAEAAEELSGRRAAIKWVNDIWMGEKKVCGILTEASVSLETGGLDFAVLGIGINVTAPAEGFPPELADIASSIFPAGQQPQEARGRMAAAVLAHFLPYYEQLSERTFMEAYRRRLFVLGREVTVVGENGNRQATALDIDRDAHLLVRYTDGETAWLTGGEISLRL